MKKLFIVLFVFTISCNQKQQVDMIVTNATIYTVDSTFTKIEAFAIKNGKFVAVGTSKDIEANFTASQTIDAKGKTIFPGFIDAHCHFYGLGLQQQRVDVTGTQNFEEVLDKVVAFQQEKKVDFIQGRGWDQNDWEVKEFPTKKELDSLFPNTPIALSRIDGHAYLVNQKALSLARITSKTKVEGGKIEVKNEKLTGILIDNAMTLVDAIIPKPSRKTQIQALLDAQQICFSYGLTTVNDAGLDRNTIELIDSLQQTGDLTIRVYAMVSNTKENLDYYLSKGMIKTDKLNVRSVKVYADGALGSRGAVLKEPYSDKPHHFGAMVTSVGDIKTVAERIMASGYQMNTHAIGDSANTVVLKTYKEVLKDNKNRRWKIEHAQVLDSEDFTYFYDDIIPSVQSTHATSDMYWATERLGNNRVKNAYAYKKLLQQAGMIVLGTDFPVEQVNPLLTFYAATARKDLNNYPENGFQMQNALTREETLKGMTIWAAYSNFEENEKGSIEVGKFADFIILDKNIMEIPLEEIPKVKVKQTYLSGKLVSE